MVLCVAWAAAALAASGTARGHDPSQPARRPAEAVQDNSFLLEEAYNQEPGVVQHIFNLSWFANERGGADDRELSLSFTQEWPLFSQAHQLSYTVPYTYLEAGGETDHGFGDILLNYRLQLLTETEERPAVAPRLSLILPTGSDDTGLGAGDLGFQTNVAVSKVVADRWTVHGNFGLTHFPDADGPSLTSYNLGASAIYAATDDLNFLVEAVARWDEERAAAGGGTDRLTSVIISPGLRYAVDLRGDTQMVVGLAVPIGLTSDAPEYGVFVYFSLEHPFGR